MSGEANTKPPMPYVPPWLAYALGEVGTLEAPGNADNPRVVEYHRATRGPASVADAVPWCSSFCNWVMQRAGIEGTRSKAARSWMGWGRSLETPRLGCVVVLWRVSITGRKGHVGIYVGPDKHGTYILGGNQGDAVNITCYPHRRVLGYRWPTKGDGRGV